MSLPGKPASPPLRSWRNAGRLLLVLAVVAPVAFLVGQSLRASNDGRANIDREQHAVAYLAALAPLTNELLAAQAAAVRGGEVPADRLSAAVAQAAQADRVWGGELRTHERWAALDLAIGINRGRSFVDAATTVGTYREIVGKLLGLYGRIRDQGGLLVDPDVDTHYLAETVAAALPRTLTAAEDYVNGLAVVAAAAPAERTVAMADVVAATEALAEGAEEVSEFLELAIAQTRSQSLGRDLVNELDAFRQSVDLLEPAGTNATAADSRRVAVRDAGIALQARILTALDGLLEDRATRLVDAQLVVVLWLVPGIVLGAAMGTAGLVRRRRGKVPTDAGTAPTLEWAGQHAR
jgi:hypothetical protein